jgi:hypothetical protein
MATSNKFNFKKVQSKLNEQTKRASILMMRESKLYFKECFEKEEFDGVKWKEVARRTAGTRYYKKQIVKGINEPSGKIFTTDQGSDWRTRKINLGTTKRMRYKTIKADSAITNKGMVATMINPVPYARYMNDGTPYVVARPFMGHAKELEKRHLTILFNETNKVWQVQP